MKLILIEPDENLRSMFELNIVQKLSYEVIDRDDASEALAFMQILPDIRMIVTKDKVGSEKTAKKLAEHLAQSGRSSVQLFVIGPNFKEEYDFCHVLPENTTPEELVEYLVKKKKIKGQSVAVEGYMPVPIKSLKYLGVYPCDIYLNMKKDGKLNFLKCFNSKEQVSSEDVEKYILKGVEKVFIKDEDFSEYVSRANIVFSNIIVSPNLSKKSKDELRKVVLRQIKNIGVNEQSLELASTLINDIQKETESNKALGVISELFNSSMGYPFQRSYMCSVFSKLIADKYDWKDQGHIEALSIAAVFSDSELSCFEEQIIYDEESLRNAPIAAERKKVVKDHAKIAAQKVSELKNISPTVEQLIRYQHGNSNGEGFHFNLADKMSPIHAIFIVSDNLARLILSSPRKKIELNNYINEIQGLYPHKHIEKALENLKSIFKS
jgi:HD-GYP domain-containing protein (c-di-GMP phosphodiesterase class II)